MKRNPPDHRAKRNASFLRLPRRLAVLLIEGYQATLSPDHGPLKSLHPYGFCQHEPTCSEYCKKAIEERGVLRGLPLGLKRIVTCTPWKKLSDAKILAITKKSP